VISINSFFKSNYRATPVITHRPCKRHVFVLLVLEKRQPSVYHSRLGLLYGALTKQQLLSLWHNGTEGSKMNPDLTVFLIWV